MCSRPALPNICAVMTTSPVPRRLDHVGDVLVDRVAPGSCTRGASSIFSKPTASPQSLMPPAMNARAMNSAVEPVAQLLLTLLIGMPVRPELVERPLARRRVAEEVADHRLVDLVVGDPGVGEGLGAGLAHHVRVVPALTAAGLHERRHPDADDEHLLHRSPSIGRSSLGSASWTPRRASTWATSRTATSSPSRTAAPSA